VTERGDPRAAARVADGVLYPLWDLRLDVGHAVRSVDDCLALAREDLTAATALLDARFLDGDRRIWERLLRERDKRLSEREAARLTQALVDEKSGRHARFGDTVYLLEPNLKNGEGGYRDLLVALWAAKARFHVADFADLLTLGQATARQVAALVEAREFFLRVRTAAHLHARRRQDRLSFEVQEAVAPALMPIPVEHATRSGIRPAVAPAVEALMQRYYLHAKAVKREGGRLLERCAAAAARKPVVRKLDGSFVLWNGQLSTSGPEVFRERPAEMVRLFRVAAEVGVEIYGHTRELVAEACGSPEALAATSSRVWP
jgi:[protein-PII] uridylyltransferase